MWTNVNKCEQILKSMNTCKKSKQMWTNVKKCEQMWKTVNNCEHMCVGCFFSAMNLSKSFQVVFLTAKAVQ